MLAAFVRLFVVVLVLVGLALLFFYAFVAALIVTPILFVLFWLFGRKSVVQWTVVRPDGYPRGQHHRPGPVIDHDPDDLPPQDQPRR
jgi:hypothetical protein